MAEEIDFAGQAAIHRFVSSREGGLVEARMRLIVGDARKRQRGHHDLGMTSGQATRYAASEGTFPDHAKAAHGRHDFDAESIGRFRAAANVDLNGMTVFGEEMRQMAEI